MSHAALAFFVEWGRFLQEETAAGKLYPIETIAAIEFNPQERTVTIVRGDMRAGATA